MSLDKIAKQLENPSIKLDVLARYAQGQNPAVPEFLALAEIKRRNTLTAHSPAPAQTTVQEDLTRSAMPQQMMPQQQQMSQQGLPAMQRPQGVAALPSGMDEHSYAGGGIIAFKNAGEVEDPDADLSYFDQFKKYITGLSGFQLDRYGVPIRPDGSKVKPGELAVNADPAKIRGALTGNNMMTPQTSADAAKFMPADNVSGNEDALYGAESLAKDIRAKDIRAKDMPTVGNKGRMAATTDADRKAMDQGAPKEDMYARYEQMLKDQGAESKAGRDQDKYMRLLEAGLGIMGGTSQYALQNIGQGAMGAAKGYAQDKAGYRKEDRDNVKELMGLGMKREEAERENKKLSIMEQEAGGKNKYYEAYANHLNTGKNDASMDKANLAAVGRAHQQLVKDASNFNSPNYGKSPEELFEVARRMVMGAGQDASVAPPAMTYDPKSRSFS